MRRLKDGGASLLFSSANQASYLVRTRVMAEAEEGWSATEACDFMRDMLADLRVRGCPYPTIADVKVGMVSDYCRFMKHCIDYLRAQLVDLNLVLLVIGYFPDYRYCCTPARFHASRVSLLESFAPHERLWNCGRCWKQPGEPVDSTYFKRQLCQPCQQEDRIGGYAAREMYPALWAEYRSMGNEGQSQLDLFALHQKQLRDKYKPNGGWGWDGTHDEND